MSVLDRLTNTGREFRIAPPTLCARILTSAPRMETASTSKEEDSARATYARGYQPLLQEDPEISVTHGPRNTVPEQPVVIQALPPYTPEQQSSQYTPAPQSFNPPQQSSSVSKISYTEYYMGRCVDMYASYKTTLC